MWKQSLPGGLITQAEDLCQQLQKSSSDDTKDASVLGGNCVEKQWDGGTINCELFLLEVFF
jgi:hypothetical protein